MSPLTQPLRVGFIGYGTIACQVEAGIRAGNAGHSCVAAALVRQERADAPNDILVTADPELGRAASRLGTLQQALAQQQRQSGPPPQSAGGRSREANDLNVPPDAGVTKVQIGANPWEQALQWRTFTIANPSGKLRSVEVRCSGHTERLQWEEGVEWRLADSWKECGLRVEARAGTTFTLYEFK